MLRKKIKSSLKSSFFPADALSMIAPNTHITGSIEADHDMRIDGHINGDIRCKSKVVIGPHAIVKGNLYAGNADLGTITGNVFVEGMLSLKSKCNINGDLTVGRLDIEAEAGFNGKCTMTQQEATTPDVTASSINATYKLQGQA